MILKVGDVAALWKNEEQYERRNVGNGETCGYEYNATKYMQYGFVPLFFVVFLYKCLIQCFLFPVNQNSMKRIYSIFSNIKLSVKSVAD